jgi:hypothetical protein
LLLAGDRIAINDVADDRELDRIVMTDLSGSAPLPLTHPSDEATLTDFDGRRVAYTMPDCIGYRALVDEIAGIAENGPRPARRCPIAFHGKRPVTQSRSGDLSVRIRCKRGCQGDVRVLARGTSDPENYLEQREFTARAGIPRTVRLPLVFGRRGVVRRRLDVMAVAYQPDGIDRQVVLTRKVRTNSR